MNCVHPKDKLTRGTMKIYDDGEIVVPGPTDSSIQIFGLSLNVRLTALHIVCPKSDRNANVVQTGR